ncbi:hypothetical protein FB45DRAFT_998043 [Roridomyces roridus]|uniref:F-box domain-containing protein n=1 Tax=Roridomyces roridus TaxID=1738132 RepID=A0AAD7CDQ6_9AGAR|nr:hypothetical protein FB45DRAFT_998043 [Roridomyces roridus]
MTDFMTSPFASLLHTNFIPSDAECQQIRTDLVSRLAQLESLNARIRELSAERDQLQAYIDSHAAALISSPRRLPADIIREIFVACLPTDRNAVMSAKEAPLLLAHICSAWRSIALTTPSLWASLHIPAVFVLEDPQRRIPAVSQWLQRSGSCPIAVSLAFMGEQGKMMNSFDDWSGLKAELMSCLAESAYRWKELDVWDLTLGVAHPLVAMIQASYSASSADSSALLRLGVFKGPHLRNMNIWQIDIDLDGPEETELRAFLLDLPFFDQHFTHLHLESMGPSRGLSNSDVFDLLSHCPRLVSFAFIHKITQDVDQNSGRDPITLSSLESFTMLEAGLISLQSVGQLLANLVLPALRKLHIPTESTISPGPSGFNPPRYHVFLFDIVGLESLLLHLPSFTEAEILEILAHFTNLAELKILDSRPITRSGALGALRRQSCCTVEGLLRLLTPNAVAGAVTVCPKLRTLEIRASSLVSRELLDGFVRGRVGLGTGFKGLDISWSSDHREQLFSPAELGEFRSRGVEVSLVVPEEKRFKPRAKSTPWTGLPKSKPEVMREGRTTQRFLRVHRRTTQNLQVCRTAEVISRTGVGVQEFGDSGRVEKERFEVGGLNYEYAHRMWAPDFNKTEMGLDKLPHCYRGVWPDQDSVEKRGPFRVQSIYSKCGSRGSVRYCPRRGTQKVRQFLTEARQLRSTALQRGNGAAVTWRRCDNHRGSGGSQCGEGAVVSRHLCGECVVQP